MLPLFIRLKPDKNQLSNKSPYIILLLFLLSLNMKFSLIS